MSKINVTIPDRLLLQIDRIAKEDYTSRSDIIRQALLFYIRSSASVLQQTDEGILFKEMKNRQLKAYLNKAVKHL